MATDTLGADAGLAARDSIDATVRLWDTRTGAVLRTPRVERCCERLDITGVTGITEAQRETLIPLGVPDRGPQRYPTHPTTRA